MNIKTLKELLIFDTVYKKWSVIDIDDDVANRLIKAGDAVAFTPKPEPEKPVDAPVSAV